VVNDELKEIQIFINASNHKLISEVLLEVLKTSASGAGASDTCA
jgi:hypothetical protein